MASSSKLPGTTAKKSILTPVMTLQGHESHFATWPVESDDLEVKDVSYISYFPDGKQMISGSRDKTIRRWDLRKGKEIKEAREVCENIEAVGVSKDGRWVVTADGMELKVSEVKTGIVRTFHEDNWINCIDISADSTLLAGGSSNGSVWIWNLDTGKLELVAGPFQCNEYVNALRFSADSRKLAVVSDLTCLQVWDVQAQKLVVTRESLSVIYSPIFWTTTHKSIVAASCFTVNSPDTTIYELDTSTLEPVGDPFQGHTSFIDDLALSSDCVLLASAGADNTIKLWSFESRQLLASFDVQVPDSLILSPDSSQLAYTTRDDTKIYVCNIPANILASIDHANETSRDLAKLLNSDATRHAVHHRPPISVISPVPRPLTATIHPPQPVFLGFLRKLLHSSRMDAVHPIRTNEPRSPLDFPATAPLPRPLVNPHEILLITPAPPTTQSSAPASTTFKSRLSSWWPLQTDHASPAIVDVPLAQAKERNAAAGAPRKNDEWIPDEDHVSTPPSPNPDSRQQTTAGQVKTNAGEHGSSRSCFCF
ncbi:WD40 repeat-like protein [Suillus weaverae]|nr:WD40 repeat-like protein [Suillus weaverae]